jgi:hypothetical protein
LEVIRVGELAAVLLERSDGFLMLAAITVFLEAPKDMAVHGVTRSFEFRRGVRA